MVAFALLAACRAQPTQPADQFPRPDRPVASIVSDSFSTEDARDRLGEAEQVMALARISPGMWIADIGAGEGYYTVRLARAVGPKGRVLAEDIVRETRDRLAMRVQRENLDNVAVRLGKADDAMLPARSFDRILLVHMYHEVESPYALLWRLREGLKPGGEIVVVDADRPANRHGMPPKLLACEFRAIGLGLTGIERITDGESYFASFKISAPRPAPGDIKPCKS
ncbi:MAG TPA: class I SAM-dependent methyltransferase [Sphingomicrobium sp.]|nr:class I SAM-dependent methyltransferase [Sphingomicrobium sp.]